MLIKYDSRVKINKNLLSNCDGFSVNINENNLKFYQNCIRSVGPKAASKNSIQLRYNQAINFIKNCLLPEETLINLFKIIIQRHPKLLVYFQEESDCTHICQLIREQIFPNTAKSKSDLFTLENVLTFAAERLKIQEKNFLL